MTAYVTGISDDVTAATYAAASCVYRSRGGGASGLVSWPAAPRSRDPLNRLFFLSLFLVSSVLILFSCLCPAFACCVSRSRSPSGPNKKVDSKSPTSGISLGDGPAAGVTHSIMSSRQPIRSAAPNDVIARRANEGEGFRMISVTVLVAASDPGALRVP